MEYIKIPRNIIEQEWYKDISTNLVYLHLLFDADEIGTILVSSRRLANLLGLSRQNVRTAFEKLVRWGMIETRVTQQLTHSVTHRITEITICNYDSYIVEDLQCNPTINPVSNPTNPTNPEEKNKTKKEEIPPHPPIEEKNKTKKEDFTENQRFSTHKNVCVCACEGKDDATEKKEPKAPPKAPLIDKRREEFRMSLEPYEQKYGKEMCENFFNYWSEYNRSKTKMRCELQKTWQLSGRLATWAKNDYRVNQPSIVYGNTTNSRYSSADNAERERLERQRSAYRLMQRLAAEDGGDPLPPLEQ